MLQLVYKGISDTFKARDVTGPKLWWYLLYLRLDWPHTDFLHGIWLRLEGTRCENKIWHKGRGWKKLQACSCVQKKVKYRVPIFIAHALTHYTHMYKCCAVYCHYNMILVFGAVNCLGDLMGKKKKRWSQVAKLCLTRHPDDTLHECQIFVSRL